VNGGKDAIRNWGDERIGFEYNSRMNKILLIIIAILLPPLAVFLKSGAGKDLLINIILCILFWIPGVLHALWVVLK
jgi:uncharacterized membrane protein YqaE (UPF0057 family)